MTTINSLGNFLQAQGTNPWWREEFPVRFRAFAAQQEEWGAKQDAWNENATIRLNRIEADMSSLKGDCARTRTPGASPLTWAWSTSAPSRTTT